MGSHGGATAAGQVRLLASLGITEASVGCPIQATMKVVQVGSITDGTPVFLDRIAAEADALLLINRVKTHTSFDGTIESGLAKICAVGLGKRQGAETMHRTAVRGLKQQLVPMARVILDSGRVLAGIAIVEDAREQTTEIVALPPAEIGGAGEAALLARSKALMARLPFHQIDVLVVDELGKNISGTGMDTNIIGRLPTGHDAVATAVKVCGQAGPCERACGAYSQHAAAGGAAGERGPASRGRGELWPGAGWAGGVGGAGARAEGQEGGRYEK